ARTCPIFQRHLTRSVRSVSIPSCAQNWSLFFFQAEDGIRYDLVTGVQTCALPISSSKLATRPRKVTLPSVGSVIRERIFSKVDLPAPFRPMMPTTSPRLTSKDTSFRAQKSSREEVVVDGRWELEAGDAFFDLRSSLRAVGS